MHIWSQTISPSATSPQQDATHFLIAFVLAITLMAADRYGEMVSEIRSVLLTGLKPIEQLSSLPKGLLNGIDRDIADFDELKRQNEILQTEILLLKANQQQLINLQQEVSRLEGLLGTTGKITDYSVQIATVSQFSQNPISQFMTLNRGRQDGVSVQNTVIDANGVIGQIVDTAAFSSRLMLITDPEHLLPVRLQRTSQRGILKGLGYDNIELNFIPTNSNVKVGDIIETSGLGGIFPSGYPVATVTKVIEQTSNPYLKILAQPVSEFNKAYKVLILKPEIITPQTLKTDLDYELNSNASRNSESNSSNQLTNQPKVEQ